jgi:acetoin utilization protein AcuB
MNQEEFMNPADITVEEFSTPNPETVSLTEKLPKIWDLMQSKGIRHILVVRGSEIVGVLSERDLTTFSQSEEFNTIEAQDIMSRDLVIVSPETKLYEVALKMSQEKIGSTIIQDSENEYTGIFTATDALNALVEVLRGDLE